LQLNEGMLRAYCSEWHGEAKVPGLGREELHHLVRVRRVRIGEAVEILNGRGDVMTCRVRNVSGKDLQLSIENHRRTEIPPLHRHLLVALPKGKTFSAILQKSVELGVAEITPLLTENSEIARDRADKKTDRWESVLIEALKQSGNPWMPVLNGPVTLDASLAGTQGDVFRLCAALQEDAEPLMKVLDMGCSSHTSVEVYVGPEGDFSPAEYRQLRDAGCRFVSLGPLVMKVETAASLVMGVLGTWSQFRHTQK